MRDAIWRFLRRNIPEGQILPGWAISVRAVLFPLDFIYWRMSLRRGYQIQTDTWEIEGVAYSAQALKWMATANGESYKITRIGRTVTMERLQEVERI